MKEIFKDIKGSEGLYQISNFGNVKSLNYNRTKEQKLLSPGLTASGYEKVDLRINGKRRTRTVHQLVAEVFLNHEPCGMKLVVNHIDFDKTNNHVSNLEIVTSRENTNRKHCKSSSRYIGVSWDDNSSKWKSRITIDGRTNHLGIFNCETKAHLTYQLELEKI
tara:strand:- start:307 stop:795 length:489 start_codon:yes stop_codon:yes gene_type:complete